MGLRSFRKMDKNQTISFRQVDNDQIKKIEPSKLSNQNWN